MKVLSGKHDKIVCGKCDGFIKVVDFEGSELRVWKALECCLSAICVSLSGRFIVSRSCDSTVKLWNDEACERLGSTITSNCGSISSVAMSRDERCSILAASDEWIEEWDTSSRSLVKSRHLSSLPLGMVRVREEMFNVMNKSVSKKY